MALGLMHATREFLSEDPGELLRAFSRQMRVVDPNFRIVKFGILPAVVEGEQRSWRRLPELRRCLRQDWRDYENRRGAGLANLPGGSAVGLVRGGIEKFRPRLGNFLRELLTKNRSAFCRHGIAGQPVSVVVWAEF